MKTLAAIALTASLLATPARAQEPASQSPQVSTEFRLDTLSRYHLRGFAYSEGMVLQPSVTFSAGNFSGTVLGNYDTNTHRWNEGDLIFQYSRPLGKHATLSTVYEFVKFDLPGIAQTQDVYATVAWNTAVQSRLTLLRDFSAGSGTYAEAGVAHTFGGKHPILFDAVLCYNAGYFRDAEGFSHARVMVSFPQTAGKFSITPSVSITEPFSGEFQSGLFYGVSISRKR